MKDFLKTLIEIYLIIIYIFLLVSPVFLSEYYEEKYLLFLLFITVPFGLAALKWCIDNY